MAAHDVEARPQTLTCDKVLVASGLHSKPKLPPIPRDSYTGTFFYGYELG